MSSSNRQNSKIRQFKKMLLGLKAQHKIKLLHRGIGKGFAFSLYNLDPNHNSIEQFAEQLFYFGEKSKYFWQQRLDNGITLNDTSNRIFKYIFQCLHEIASSTFPKTRTLRYRKLNQKSFDFFSISSNRRAFLKRIDSLSVGHRQRYRNFYLRIIHQLGETDYKKKSFHISATENLDVARWFAHDQIIINFWDFDFNHFTAIDETIPVFTGKPYKNQQEISVFSAIFPHHIYSFYYSGFEYLNPALFSRESLYAMIMNGFTIDQTDFETRLKQTRFRKGVRTDGLGYWEVKPFTNQSQMRKAKK